MAVNELSGFLRYKDSEGNTNLLYPITTKDNVDGIDEIETELAETVKFTAQALDDNQKAQVRTNIGAISNDDIKDAIADMDLSVDDAVTIDVSDSNVGTPSTINADTLGGKTEGMLSVLRAVDATNAENANTLGGYSVDSLVDKIYPIGSIYMSVNSTSPADLFGGTWEQLKDTFLLASGDTYGAGATGGEATHTLTVDEMPPYLAVYMWKRTA